MRLATAMGSPTSTLQRAGGGLCAFGSTPRVGIRGCSGRALASSHGLGATAAGTGGATWRTALRGAWRDPASWIRHRTRTLATDTDTLASPSAVDADSPPGTAAPSTWKAPLDFRFIRDNVELVAANCANRNSAADPHRVAELFGEFLEGTQEVNALQQERNAHAKRLKGKMEADARAALVDEGKRLKQALASCEARLEAVEVALQAEGRRIPNLTHPDVPLGGEEDSTVLRVNGTPRAFPDGFDVKDHVALGESLGCLDFEAAAVVSGSKFYYLKKEAALLELALINWSMQRAAAKGYEPTSTPDLVRGEVLEKCGFQPRGDSSQNYGVSGSDLFLTGTAEIPLGGAVMDTIFKASDLPIKMAGYGRCFRTEAGAAGSKGRGLYRVHQFSKVEMFVVCHPDESEAIHAELLEIECAMFEELGLHFKVLDMASHDLGAPAYRKFDVEAWMPGISRYGEISSASNCTDFQARRLNIRYRPEQGVEGEAKGKKKKAKTEFAHTLNATACAVPRMIVAIFENFQEADGSVRIPEVLWPFMGGVQVIKPVQP